MKRLDLIGKRFGKLIVMGEAEYHIQPCGVKLRRYICQCDCGNKSIVKVVDLNRKHTQSCGCLLRKHGHNNHRKRTKTYRAWCNMNERCHNPRHKYYKHYGARGVEVCNRWQGEDGFINFLNDMGECPKGKSLDRYPNQNGNYELSNCRWATILEQNNNKRNNVKIKHYQNYISMSQFARINDIDYSRFKYLYRKKGLSIEQILSLKGD